MAPGVALALAGLVGGAGLTHWRAVRREARAEADNPPRGEIVELSGTRMHAFVTGKGPDLVLIHGLSGSLNDFSFGLIDRLAHDYRVIAVDRPGKGWSAPVENGWQLARQADLIRATAAHFGAARPLVMGHSYGGAVGLAWAVHHPDSLAGLITVAAPSHARPDSLGWYYTVTSHPLLRPVAVPLLAAWLADTRLAAAVDDVFAPQQAPPGYGAHFGPAMTIRRAAMRANADCRVHLKPEIKLLQPNYPQIDLPLEIVHGARDDIVPAALHGAALAHDVPGAKYTELPGIGHMPHHVATRQTIAAIHRAASRAGLR